MSGRKVGKVGVYLLPPDMHRVSTQAHKYDKVIKKRLQICTQFILPLKLRGSRNKNCQLCDDFISIPLEEVGRFRGCNRRDR